MDYIKESIINVIDKEITNLIQYYKQKIGDLENEILVLKSEQNRLENENQDLITNLTLSPLKYWNRISIGISNEVIEEWSLSSDVGEAYILLLTCESLIREGKFRKAQYIFDLLNKNYKQLLHNERYIPEVYGKILQLIFVENREDIDEEFENLVISSLKLLIRMRNSTNELNTIKFIKTYFKEILENILYLNNPSIITRFMRVCMRYNLRTELKSIFLEVLDVEWGFLDSSITEDDFVFLLWYSYLFDCDDQLLDRASVSKQWFRESNNNLSLYFYLKESLNKTIIPNHQTYKASKKLFKDGKLITLSEQKEVIKKVEKVLYPLMPKEEKTIVENEILVIKDELIEQYIQKYGLVWREVSLPLYKSENENSVQGHINETILMSKGGKNALMSMDSFKRINKEQYPLIIKTKNRQKIVKKENHIQVEMEENYSFKWPETELKNSNNTTVLAEKSMNENSALKLMGYQITGTTKESRWAVLEKAVPILGLKRVAYIIAYNIKLRKGQKDGSTKFHNSISKWEYDLAKLKKEYYKNEFVWPVTHNFL